MLGCLYERNANQRTTIGHLTTRGRQARAKWLASEQVTFQANKCHWRNRYHMGAITDLMSLSFFKRLKHFLYFTVFSVKALLIYT